MIKLGSVPFLNATPLIYPLETRLVEHNFDIKYFDPNILSQKLSSRDIDLGLIPVGELITRNDYFIVPDISISSFGKVDSVLLLTKGDINNVSVLAVDRRSQSSSALLKIVMESYLGIKAEYIKKEINARFLDGVDGGMLIGDEGLKAAYSDNGDLNMYDLGEMWTDWTGYPFVYAVFAVRRGVDLANNLNSLLEAKKLGKKLVSRIVEKEAIGLGLTNEQCEIYLTERIKYGLGAEEIKGLIKYSELLFDLNFIENRYEIKLYGRSNN